MDKVNCLIVDDEPLARELITTYCLHLPFLQVAAICGNAIEAKRVLAEKEIDIIFLDIHLPVLDGIGFLQTLRHQPQVIMTTAYQEYAVRAFDLAVCDYLVKPFSIERFIIAVDRAIDRLNVPVQITTQSNANLESYLFIKTDWKIYKINHEDLLYAEANGNYTKITTKSEMLTPSIPFSSFEKLLPPTGFIRVHRSFIVNKSKISRIEGNRIFIQNFEIPIGTNYKEAFLRSIGLQ